MELAGAQAEVAEQRLGFLLARMTGSPAPNRAWNPPSSVTRRRGGCVEARPASPSEPGAVPFAVAWRTEKYLSRLSALALLTGPRTGSFFVRIPQFSRGCANHKEATVRTLRGALLLALVAGLLAGPVRAADPLKIGFITSLSGPAGVIGKHMKDSVELALDHLGRKMGGLDVEVIYGDDQRKPDVGKQLADEMLKKHKVSFVSGIIWSNVMLAVAPTVTGRGPSWWAPTPGRTSSPARCATSSTSPRRG